MTRKPLNQLLGIIISIFILTFFSCTKQDSKTISIGILEGPSTVSFIKMIHQPPTIEGKEVKFIIKSDPMHIQALMMQNKLDFAVLPTVMAANLYNKGVDYRLLAIPIWGTLYLASNDSSVQCIKALKNQTIHIFGQGATADILLQKYLQNKNIHELKFDYSYSSNQEIAMALLHKKIKNAVVSEPQMSVLLSKDTGIHILTEITCEDIDSLYNRNIFAQTSFLVNSRLSSDYNDLIQAVSTAYAESCIYTTQYTDEAAKLLLKHGYYPDLITAFRSIPLCNIHYVPASEIKEKIDRYLNVFYTAEPKSVGGKMPDNDFIFRQESSFN